MQIVVYGCVARSSKFRSHLELEGPDLAATQCALHAWRNVPTSSPPVGDLNNVTDGDEFVAVTLSRPGWLWGRPDYLKRLCLASCARPCGGWVSWTVLLSGIKGFETSDIVIVNLSFYAFPMMTEFGRLAMSAHWERLRDNGRRLIG
jgi:endoglucanase